MDKLTKKKVSCHIITYNHKDYIAKCIDGVLMQQVSFPIEIIIGDDVSTDGTREIIKEYALKYPELIKLNLREKRGKGIPGKQNFISTLQMCTGEYISLCDGDDYWTDPLKLQKQVDFLDANKDYTICWTNYLIKEESNNNSALIEPDWTSILDERDNITIDLNSIFNPYCTYSLTTLFRRTSLDLLFYEKLKHGKDNSLYAYCLSSGKGVLMNFKSSVYRLHAGGVYSSDSIFKQKYFSYLNLEEIIREVPKCKNLNITTIRNSLLIDSLKIHPNQLSLSYFYLIIDGFKFIGLKKTVRLIINKFKSGSFKK